MPTFLFDKIIFGPVQSRRLGVSLGINLLPINKKICSFDCIYCECGLNEKLSKGEMPAAADVHKQLELKLIEMSQAGKLPDVITFAGNGEPTLHPDFNQIIEFTLKLRSTYCPNARVAVLSNAFHIDKAFEGLLKVDDNILKLDSGLESTICSIDRPNGSFSILKIVENLKRFEGRFIMQTMLIKGSFNGELIDNTTEENLLPWLEIIAQTKPRKVMIYTIDRSTPVNSIEKIDAAKLNEIAARVELLGIQTQVSG